MLTNDFQYKKKYLIVIFIVTKKFCYRLDYKIASKQEIFLQNKVHVGFSMLRINVIRSNKERIKFDTMT